MIKSDCENIQNLIPLYIDNMLSEEETGILCEHIAGCKACKEELIFMQAVIGKTAKLPEISVSPNFHEMLMEKVRKEPFRTKQRFAFSWKNAASFVAAAAVVALSVVSFLSLDKDGGNQNPDVYLASPAPGAERALQEQNPPKDMVQENAQDAQQAKMSTSPSTAEKTAQPKTTTAPIAGPSRAAAEAQNHTSSETNAPSDAVDVASEHAPAVARTIDDAYSLASGVEVALDKSEETQDAKSWSRAQETDAEEKSVAPENTGGFTKHSGGGDGGASGGGATAAVERFTVATVTVSRQAIEQAKEILSVYVKDANGYKVGAGLQEALLELSALEGYSVSMKKTTDISGNYIALY